MLAECKIKDLNVEDVCAINKSDKKSLFKVLLTNGSELIAEGSPNEHMSLVQKLRHYKNKLEKEQKNKLDSQISDNLSASQHYEESSLNSEINSANLPTKEDLESYARQLDSSFMDVELNDSDYSLYWASKDEVQEKISKRYVQVRYHEVKNIACITNTLNPGDTCSQGMDSVVTVNEMVLLKLHKQYAEMARQVYRDRQAIPNTNHKQNSPKLNIGAIDIAKQFEYKNRGGMNQYHPIG